MEFPSPSSNDKYSPPKLASIDIDEVQQWLRIYMKHGCIGSNGEGNGNEWRQRCRDSVQDALLTEVAMAVIQEDDIDNILDKYDKLLQAVADKAEIVTPDIGSDLSTGETFVPLDVSVYPVPLTDGNVQNDENIITLRVYISGDRLENPAHRSNIRLSDLMQIEGLEGK